MLIYGETIAGSDDDSIFRSDMRMMLFIWILLFFGSWKRKGWLGIMSAF
jgi:hypothetical protein